MKETVAAPANIAFVKYWGARDPDRGLPLNPSISMTLTRCVSVCTAELLDEAGADEVWIVDGGGPEPAPEPFARPVRAHLERIRRRAGRRGAFRVATRNTFPTAAGLASSASGFAALTLAALRAAGSEVPPEEASDLARRSGSGSAARSVFGGYVEWPVSMEASAAPEPEEARAPARPLAPAEHWDLRDVIAIVDEGPKRVSSREGHRRVPGSPYFPARLALLPERLERTREAIAARDFARLVPVLEEEAADLHLQAMSARPPILYWAPGSLEVIAAVLALRDGDGVAAAWTMDAGPNVHVICPAAAEEAVAERLAGLAAVRRVIRDGVGPGPRSEREPLF